jgi:membrane-bound metal-dependent hydrolase YbcI (DUF457 family)
MTFFEHAMVGVNAAMAVGLLRRRGWPIVAMAGFAALLPDWDGLTILFGANSYADGHRVWGHNLLVAGGLAILVCGSAHCFEGPQRIQRWLGGRWQAFALPEDRETSAHPGDWLLWPLVGVLAAYSHLLADVFFSAGRDGQIWKVPLLWPFSDSAFAYPLVYWGDVGVTLIFVVEMFALLRWRAWSRSIASCSLALAIGYMAASGFVHFRH